MDRIIILTIMRTPIFYGSPLCYKMKIIAYLVAYAETR